MLTMTEFARIDQSWVSQGEDFFTTTCVSHSAYERSFSSDRSWCECMHTFEGFPHVLHSTNRTRAHIRSERGTAPNISTTTYTPERKSEGCSPPCPVLPVPFVTYFFRPQHLFSLPVLPVPFETHFLRPQHLWSFWSNRERPVEQQSEQRFWLRDGREKQWIKSDN